MPVQLPRHRVPRWLPWTSRRVVELLVIALIVEYLLLPQIAGTHRWLHLLVGVNTWWLLAGLGCELASLLAFTLATRVFLPRDETALSIWRLWRIDLAGIAVSHAVPGGAAAGTALGYRLLRRSGIEAPAASFAKLGQGAVSALMLQALLVTSVAIAIPLHGSSPLYLTACLAGAGIVVTLAVLTAVLIRSEETVAKLAGRLTKHLPRMSFDTGHEFALRLAEQIRLIARRPRLFVASAAWSAANWLLDAAALWCCVTAFGHVLGYDGLLVPFCLANTAAWIPLTPSGLGVVEGVIVPTLVGFHTPRGIALLGTITWRLLNFWLPIPLGAGAYLTLVGRARNHEAEPEPEPESG